MEAVDTIDFSLCGEAGLTAFALLLLTIKQRAEVELILGRGWAVNIGDVVWLVGVGGGEGVWGCV
jgi:hypothetical protein